MNEKAKVIAGTLVGLKYYEWCKVKTAIEKAYASEISSTTLDNSEAVEKLIELEL